MTSDEQAVACAEAFKPLASVALRETAWDECIRTEQIIWLACQADQYTDALKNFFTDGTLDATELSQLLGVKFTEDELEKAYNTRRNDDHIGDFLYRLQRAGKLGFLVQAATPVPQAFHEDGGVTFYGFGHYTTQWFYTDALDEAFMERLVEWKNAYIEKQRSLAGQTASTSEQ